MNKLEMQIQSIDARYDSNTNIIYYNLSCSLLNVYKGSVTYKAVADTFGHKFLSPADALI